MPGDDEAEIVRPVRVWPMPAHTIGPDDARIKRAAVHVFHALVAVPRRRGRLSLSGDNAHQPPLPRARHVRRHPGRRQPRLEARVGGGRRGRRTPARPRGGESDDLAETRLGFPGFHMTTARYCGRWRSECRMRASRWIHPSRQAHVPLDKTPD